MAAGPHLLFPGCASVTFDQPIFLKTRGEQVLYVNVEGRGIVTITGCCHPGVLGLLKDAKGEFRRFSSSRCVGGWYPPFEEWGPPQEEVRQAAGVDVGKFAGTIGRARRRCGRCGSAACPWPAARRGHGSKSVLYPGNGDTIDF